MEENKKVVIAKREDILISHSPHMWRGFSISKIMYIVVIALLLPTGASIYYFGFSALWVIIASTATAVLTEFVIKKLQPSKSAK